MAKTRYNSTAAVARKKQRLVIICVLMTWHALMKLLN